MTNARFDRIEDFRDIESLNHYAEAVANGAPRGACSRRCARWAATTRAPRCSGTRASTPASRPASRGSPSTRPRRSTPRPRAPTRTRCFHHYRRLIELRHARAGRRARRLHACCCPTTSRSTRSRALGGVELLVLGSFSASAPVGLGEAGASSCSAATPTRARGAAAPWEARVLRRRMTPLEIVTPRAGARAPARADHPRGALVLGHGAGGAWGARTRGDVGGGARRQSVGVSLVERPSRVQGRKSPAPQQLDAASDSVVDDLRGDVFGGLPLITGGRSAARASPADGGWPCAAGIPASPYRSTPGKPRRPGSTARRPDRPRARHPGRERPVRHPPPAPAARSSPSRAPSPDRDLDRAPRGAGGSSPARALRKTVRCGDRELLM